jgi:hypothetical protein
VTESDRCYFDWVKIFQRHYWSTSMEEVGKYCGSSIPPPRRIKDMVLISFRSDSSYQAQGFHLKYEVDSKYPVSVLLDDLKLQKCDPKKNSYPLVLSCLVVIIMYIIIYLNIYSTYKCTCSCGYVYMRNTKHKIFSQILFF